MKIGGMELSMDDIEMLVRIELKNLNRGKEWIEKDPTPDGIDAGGAFIAPPAEISETLFLLQIVWSLLDPDGACRSALGLHPIPPRAGYMRLKKKEGETPCG